MKDAVSMGMDASVLIVDDEETMQDMLGLYLSDQGYRVSMARSGEEALARLEAGAFDLLITDLIMPGIGGLDVLEKARALDPRIAVILITAYATVETAVEALRRRASDFVVKPFGLDELKSRIQRSLHARAANSATRVPPSPERGPYPAELDGTIRGDSAAMRLVRRKVAKVAATPSNVLITGESGTGKELVARAIHAASPRRGRPFVPINCGAIPETLLETQLFGHTKGAFTSAVQPSPGLFVVAHGGILFLDEIGELPLPLQVKLLRVIEDGEVWPVGSPRAQRVDVRLIASTNRDLTKEVSAGRFREDLFYRLDVVRIELPPLRERREDIPLLVRHFIEDLNVKLATNFSGVGDEALAALVNHGWRGNVRELQHVLESAMILGDGDVILRHDLPAEFTANGRETRNLVPLKAALQEFERRHIGQLLEHVHFDKKEAARRLGISLASLYRKLGARST